MANKPSNIEYGELYQEYMKVIEELEKCKKIEKDLEVLEIIKNKLNIDKNDLMTTRTTKCENYYFCEAEITKEEYIKLNEWLENGKV